MLTTVLAFLVTIGVLVVIHEYGHYRAALACDVKVLRFSVGFGRVLWSRQRGETEFVLSALPLGGYVKMLDEREGVVAQSERHRAFNRKPVWQRAIVVAAGPAANLGLAVLLYACVNWAGVEELRPWFAQPRAESMAAKAGLRAQDEIVALRPLNADEGNAGAKDGDGWIRIRSMNDLQWHLTQATLRGDDLRLQVQHRPSAGQPSDGEREMRLPLSEIDAAQVDAQLMDRIGLTGPYADPVIERVIEDGPAEKAGLRAGDWILEINGQQPQDASQLFAAIRESHEQGRPRPIAMRVKRGGEVLDIVVTPAMKEVQGRQVPRIEASLGSRPATIEVSYGFVDGLGKAVDKTWEVSALSLSMLGKMLVGEASIRNLSGPITIADYAGKSANLGWVYYVGFLALVSVSLGVLNLLPLPVLDGGHLMYYLFEGVTGRPVPERWLERLQRGGVAIMLMMMSLALYNDLARLAGAH